MCLAEMVQRSERVLTRSMQCAILLAFAGLRPDLPLFVVVVVMVVIYIMGSRATLCIFTPHATPNKLLLTVVMLFS
jgi:hypothetical protein